MSLNRRQVLLGSTLIVCNVGNGVAQQQERPLRLTRPIINNSSGHVVLPRDAFRYTFDQIELANVLNQRNASIIVHHGTVPASPNYAVLHTHVEGMPLFVSKNAALGGIKADHLKLLVTGQVKNWRDLGGSDAPVDIGVRGDGVFLRSAQSIFRRHSLTFPAGAFAGNSYEELASYGAAKPGALLIGLRGQPARNSDLIELDLDGKKVSTSTSSDYPLANQVSLLLRNDDPLAVELGYQFASGLRARLLEDGMQSKINLVNDLEMALRNVKK